MIPWSQRGTLETGWYKSSYSSSAAACVETRFDDGQVVVRDSKKQHTPASEPILNVATVQWTAFIADLQA